MKEATGELNMTVITVVAIAAVAAFFYAFVWPAIQSSIAGSTACNVGPGGTSGSAGQPGYVSCSTMVGGTYTCDYVYGSASDPKSASKTCQQN